ncbi:MAG: PCMD domain-containing protein [Alistipes sp.]|nr:PCMD domain-containing protein [Alistipes sp.]
MKRRSLYILALALAGCIENDIPYPVVECAIESIEAEGLSGDPTIDATARKVILPLEETTDIQAVKITACTITERAEASKEIVGEHDLQSPLYVTLSIYQDYPWTIEAQQTIERRFTVAEQIGSTVWDLANSTAKAYVGFEDLSHVEIMNLKLGPQGITHMSCTDVEDFNETNLYLLTDFATSRRVDVTYHNRTEKWYLAVEYTDIKVSFTQVAPWTHSAWLYADGLSGTTLGFRYREEGAEEWIEVPQEEIVFDGGSFSTQIRGLLPETKYEAVAYSNDDLSTVETFTTEAALPLPNGGFEEWSKPGKIVYPYLSEQDAFWDSGNKGSAAVNETICEGSSDIRPGSEGQYSAHLVSKFASLMGIGKFAAGNIFIGTYYNTVGTDGQVNFGRPFATHPIALRGWMKYTQGQIDKIGKVPSGTNLTTDSMDEGSIYIALGTWTPEEYGGTEESPVQVFTKDLSTLFNKDGKDVLGYGELIFTESVDEWTQFTIPIDWRDKTTVPTHLIIVCSGSRWGDYFTGSTQSGMWLDDFELIYDDAEL